MGNKFYFYYFFFNKLNRILNQFNFHYFDTLIIFKILNTNPSNLFHHISTLFSITLIIILVLYLILTIFLYFIYSSSFLPFKFIIIIIIIWFKTSPINTTLKNFYNYFLKKNPKLTIFEFLSSSKHLYV
jgi:hypothetical protein